MFYSNEEAYDMLLILGECRAKFSWKIVTGTISWSDSSLAKHFFTFG